MKQFSYLLIGFVLLHHVNQVAWAEDWPMWGGDASRNMVSTETGIPHAFDIGQLNDDTDEVDLSTTKNVKWAVKLGSLAYGNVTVGQGKVLVGTNNEFPRNPNITGDRGVLMCFEEASGNFLWQLIVPKLKEAYDSDLGYLGICSSPTIENERVYIVTNRCEAVCLDLNGLGDGNDGPFTNEARYMAPKGEPPIGLGQTEADILWVYDMRKELDIHPHNITSSSILIVNDRLFVTTSNGVDGTHETTPSPDAPCLIALDKHTGTLLGTEQSGISQRMLHCNWSSPAYGMANQQGVVVFGGGDGYCYGFDPLKLGENQSLVELWRFNCIPEAYQKHKYTSANGPSEIISTPVIHDGLAYACIGQDPENGDGAGFLACIDASKRGDITKNGAVWTYKKIRRSLSTPSIVNDLLFIADYAGFVRCLDAKTGKEYWVHDTFSCIWGSTLAVDGKIYIGNEDGFLIVLKADKKKEVLATIDMGASVYSTPVVANGVLYVSTQTHLYAVEE
ncbi:PQQ-binding-like beta-propeller repeat protein [bacterium]|nr:PQQ-binding-like beta-propeller repeat protein [bacterium]